jgi:hypothetical protein
MFVDELTPVVRELASYPIAFLGGFFSGLLRLDLSQDPIKSWLDQKGGPQPPAPPENGRNGGPQSITIE